MNDTVMTSEETRRGQLVYVRFAFSMSNGKLSIPSNLKRTSQKHKSCMITVLNDAQFF
jgi:hypothetical protein